MSTTATAWARDHAMRITRAGARVPQPGRLRRYCTCCRGCVAAAGPLLRKGTDTEAAYGRLLHIWLFLSSPPIPGH